MISSIQDICLEDFDLSLSGIRMVNQASIIQVEKSLAKQGQLHPVIFRIHEDCYQLIDGFKRYYAAQKLLLKSLQGLCVDVDLVHAKVLLLIYNRPHRSMEAWEEALILHDLKTNHHHDLKSLSTLTGYSRSWVSRRLSLVEKMDATLSDEIKMGRLTSSHARELIRLPRGNQKVMASVIINHHLGSRQSQVLTDSFIRAKSKTVQDYIIQHPHEVLRQSVIDQEDSYDARLSAHGNEVLKSGRYLKKSIDIMNARLQDCKTKDLACSEQDILFEIFHNIFRSSKHLITLIEPLQKRDNI